MKKVWLIEQGVYSDYRVVGVFSTKENADLVCKEIKKSDYHNNPEVREWNLDPGVSQLNKGYLKFRVLMLRNGDTEDISPINYFELEEKCYIWERSKAEAYKGKGLKDVLDAEIWAKSKQHAIKIVNEKRGQMIANGEWK